MNFINTITARLNAFQQTHPVIGFPYAVIKKYGDDHGSYHAALLTYYGFLSLFPLLLVLLTLLHLWFSNDQELQRTVAENIRTYFPLLGNQLQTNVETIRGTGLGLIVGMGVAIYGAKGGADALRFALDSLWSVPKSMRTGFPAAVAKSFGVLGIAALGFIATTAVSVATSGWGEALWVKMLLNVLGLLVLAISLAFAFRIGISKHLTFRAVIRGALIAGAAVQLLLTFGSIIVASQLKNLDSLYGTFAIVLGLLFWIYLLAQVLLYAVEIDTVREHHLWPRSMDNNYPTPADKRAYKLQAKTERHIPKQAITVAYRNNNRANKDAP